MTRGPWLQSVSWTNLIVKWRTSARVNGQVRFGTNATNLLWRVRHTTISTDHSLTLTNLAPGTKYFYSVGTTRTNYVGGTNYYFTTSPLPGTRKRTRVWALGDSGTADTNQFNVRDAFYAHLGTNELDLMLLLGDNAYGRGLDREYQAALFNAYPTMLRKTALWSTIGNHETAQDRTPVSTIPYYKIFSLPKAGQAGGTASGTEDYYSFDYANIHFVCLDSMTSSRSATGTMARWLTNDLASTAQPWIVAFWHHPPYSKGTHDSDKAIELVQMRQNILPHLERYGVDLVLCGHSHSYERSHLLNGHYGTTNTLNTTNLLDTGGGRADGNGPYMKPPGATGHKGTVYVVSGSAGKIAGGALNHPAMFLSLNQLGSLYFEVSGDRLEAQFIRETREIADYFTIVKEGTPYQLTRTGNMSRITWNSVLGLTYLVDYASDPASLEWNPTGPAIPGNGGWISITNVTGMERCFYRIRTQ